MTTPLTDATVDRINRMFSLPDQDLVSTLLIEECGDNLPLSTAENPASLERIRFAVLKLSGGDHTRLLTDCGLNTTANCASARHFCTSSGGSSPSAVIHVSSDFSARLWEKAETMTS